MSYEVLLVIAALCQTSGEYSATARYLAFKCQKEMLECVGASPSPTKIVECVKQDKTKP